jgi:hypothetical protein
MGDFPDMDPVEFCDRYPCDPNPCKNGGSCIFTGIDAFECECLRSYRGETCEFHLDTFEVPFAVSAIDFYEYRENYDGPNGNCETYTSVDAKIASDSSCMSKVFDKTCFVGWTKSGDWLSYKFHNEKNYNPVNVVVTLASARSDKVVNVLIVQSSSGLDAQLMTAPGKGWDVFEKRVLPTKLNEGNYLVFVQFETGDVNLCSVAVEERPYEWEGAVAPFTTGAIDYTSAYISPSHEDEDAGDCYGRAAPFSAAFTEDPRCLGNDSTGGRSCFVGWLRANDTFQFAFRANEAGQFYVKVVLASKRSDKRVRVEVTDHGEVVGDSVVLYAPGLGWREFKEYYVPVNLTKPGEFEVDLRILDGKVNLCAVGVVLEGLR